MDIRIGIPQPESDPHTSKAYEMAVSALEGRGVSCERRDGWLVFALAADKRSQVRGMLEEMGVPVSQLEGALQMKVSVSEMNPLERLQSSAVFG